MTTVAPSRRPLVSADPIAAILLVLGGAAGVIGMLLPWLPADPRLASGSKTGWDLFVIGRAQDLPVGQWLAVYAVLATAVAGGACLLLGLAMLSRVDHHPLGAVAMLLGFGAIAALLWWTYDRQRTLGGLGTLFGQIHTGWYLAAASGLLAVAGAIRALSRP